MSLSEDSKRVYKHVPTNDFIKTFFPLEYLLKFLVVIQISSLKNGLCLTGEFNTLKSF